MGGERVDLFGGLPYAWMDGWMDGHFLMDGFEFTGDCN